MIKCIKVVLLSNSSKLKTIATWIHEMHDHQMTKCIDTESRPTRDIYLGSTNRRYQLKIDQPEIST